MRGPQQAAKEARHGRKDVRNQKAGCAVELLYLRHQDEQRPGVHRNVPKTPVQETGCKQPPPLTSQDQGSVLRAKKNRNLPANTRAVGKFVADANFRQIERDVDDQNDNCREVRSRKKGSSELAGPHVNGTWPQLHTTIRADAISHRNEGPAVWAHAALFHGLIVAAAVTLP